MTHLLQLLSLTMGCWKSDGRMDTYTCGYIYTHTVYTVIFYAAPLENPEEEPFEKECSFSNHQFSWDMFVAVHFPMLQ